MGKMAQENHADQSPDGYRGSLKQAIMIVKAAAIMIINRSPQKHRTGASAPCESGSQSLSEPGGCRSLFIGREPRKGGLIDWKTIMNKKASKLLQDLDIHADVTQTIDNYSIAIQQMQAIACSRYVGKGDS